MLFDIVGFGRKAQISPKFNASPRTPNLKARIINDRTRPVIAGVITALAGIALWSTSFGERWRFASYDTLFRLANRSVTNFVVDSVTNEVVVVLMDAYPWDRARHANFLERLANDRCPLVAFDVFFTTPKVPVEPAATEALLSAIKRCSNVVLMARQSNYVHHIGPRRPGISRVEVLLPLDTFREAAGQNNWGVGSVNTNSDGVVRQHWRFPSPGAHYDSLAWTTARIVGAQLGNQPKERWVRYYGGDSWTSLSYEDAETQPEKYFENKVVFIGISSRVVLPDGNRDEFKTPFTRRSGIGLAGVEILATEFLNLVGHDWLRRPAASIEACILILIGMALGASLCCRAPRVIALWAIVVAVGTLVAGVCLSYFTNVWFPWLIIAAGQVPAACLVGAVWRKRLPITSTIVIQAPTPAPRVAAGGASEETFDAPDYELIEPPFGKGAYGRVWLARNAVGQWQALKAVYRAKFGEDSSPYEREFRGIEHYKRVSDKHPGLLRIDFVSRMKPEGFFYYAMELGDGATPDWEKEPTLYKPLDLAAVAATFEAGRVPVRDCIRLATKLCEPLHFLHSQGLTHRDIKPRNIIFVNGEPKLADVGLVTDAHRSPQEVTWVGTPGYMPPEPEPPGTPQADIFGLGMVLYVISTGDKPKVFPELSTTLVDRNRHPDFGLLSAIIFKACQPDREKRFRTAEEMRAALLEATAKLSM